MLAMQMVDKKYQNAGDYKGGKELGEAEEVECEKRVLRGLSRESGSPSV